MQSDPASHPQAFPDPSLHRQDTVSEATLAVISSDLDTLETKVRRLAQELEPQTDTPDPGVAFRHSGWQDARKRTAAAMNEATYDPMRLHRFAHCGNSAWVYVDQENPAVFKITCNKCKDRWCEPCQRELRLKLARNLVDQLPNQRLRFLTLTLRHCSMTLGEQIDRLYDCFRRFRRRKKIASSIDGGIFFLELGWNALNRQWHPHLHVLFTGHYLPLAVARKEWHLTTGDSYILDIREVKDPRIAAGYVTKYAGKLLPGAVRADHAAFAEAIKNTEGRRTFGTFGTWRKLKLTAAKPSDRSWLPLGRLETIIALARTGDRDANNVLLGLSSVACECNSADDEEWPDAADG